MHHLDAQWIPQPKNKAISQKETQETQHWWCKYSSHEAKVHILPTLRDVSHCEAKPTDYKTRDTPDGGEVPVWGRMQEKGGLEGSNSHWTTGSSRILGVPYWDEWEISSIWVIFQHPQG